MVSSLCKNATEVRKNWSMTIDSVVHERPAFISRTHGSIAMIDESLLMELLRDYKYHLSIDVEEDGSFTAFLDELELVENAPTKEECIDVIISAMKDYAMDYYNEFSYWSKAPNRAPHIPYVIKILVSSDNRILEDIIICQIGEN